jgi:hypothetical protein
MSTCQYPDCSTGTNGHRYCQCHNAWVRRSGLCYNCLVQKENPKHKLCAACHQAELEAERKCHYPNCGAVTTEGHPYCPCHNAWLRSNGQCYKCLRQKEDTQFKLCQACHQEEMRATAQVNRQLAIKQGLCTNYWKCHNAAAPDGRMCATCYEEYRQRHAQAAPAGERVQPARSGERVQLAIKRPEPQPAEAAEVEEAESQ